MFGYEIKLTVNTNNTCKPFKLEAKDLNPEMVYCCCSTADADAGTETETETETEFNLEIVIS